MVLSFQLERHGIASDSHLLAEDTECQQSLGVLDLDMAFACFYRNCLPAMRAKDLTSPVLRSVASACAMMAAMLNLLWEQQVRFPAEGADLPSVPAIPED